MSPATAEPPIPQKVTALTSSTSGRSVTATARRIALAGVGRHRRHDVEHAAGIPGAQGPEVVQVGHFAAPGFSASSISMTGMPSRTG